MVCIYFYFRNNVFCGLAVLQNEITLCLYILVITWNESTFRFYLYLNNTVG